MFQESVKNNGAFLTGYIKKLFSRITQVSLFKRTFYNIYVFFPIHIYVSVYNKRNYEVYEDNFQKTTQMMLKLFLVEEDPYYYEDMYGL